ncbi:MAG: MFS transporter [Hyphomicrobiaceae bacterium]
MGQGQGKASSQGEEARTAIRGLSIRISVFYGALFVILGMHVPFTPVWLASRGLSAGEISAILAVPFFLRVLVTPTLALSADRRDCHRRYMIMLAWLALLSVLALSQASHFWTVLLLVAPLVIANSSMMPLAETIAVRGVRESGLDYGRTRLWGSLTFIAASFLGGLLMDRLGAGAGVWLVAFGCALTVVAAHLLPVLPVRNPPPASIRAQAPLWHVSEPRQLLGSKVFAAFLIAAGGSQAAHATMLTYGTLIWQGQGLSAGMGGALWAVAVLAEVGLFAVSAPLLARYGAANFLIAGAGVSIVRWVVMAFDPPLSVLVPLQALHALTYAGTHIGAIYFIAQAVPPSMQGSAQALYATIASGVAMGLATLASGAFLTNWGSGPAYAAMAVIALVALAGALVLKREWQGEVLFSPTEPDADAPAVTRDATPRQRAPA